MDRSPDRLAWRVRVAVAALAVLVLPLAACGRQTPPATTQGPQSAAPPAGQSAAQKPVELRLGHFLPTTHSNHVHMLEPWAKEIAAKSGGRIKITIHPGGVLAKPPEQYDAAVQGVMDISYGLQSYTPARFPLTSVAELPYLFKSAQHATKVLWRLYQESAALRDEYRDVKVLALWTHDIGELMTKKPVKTLEDLKGLRLRGPGAVQIKQIASLGATPVHLPIPEVYDALSRGVLEGLLIPYSGVADYRFDEVAKYVTEGHFYVATFFLVMNKQSWERLSESDRKLIDELSGERLAMLGAKAFDDAAAAGRQRAERSRVQVYQLPPDELARWKEATARVRTEWVSELQGKGLPAKDVYDRAVALAAQQ